jgi:hypothetical protein
MATVNKPSDVKQKEADVNRKLQVYGIINAFQLGKVPSVGRHPHHLPFRLTHCYSLHNNCEVPEAEAYHFPSWHRMTR